MPASIIKDNCPVYNYSIYTTTIGESLCSELMLGNISTILFETTAVTYFSSKYIKMNEMLQSIKGIDFESENMDVVSLNVIENASSILRLLAIKNMPIYHVSPGRGGEILLELKNGFYEVEIYVYPNEKPELLIYNNDKCLFDGEFTLNNLTQYFLGLWQSNYSEMMSY